MIHLLRCCCGDCVDGRRNCGSCCGCCGCCGCLCGAGFVNLIRIVVVVVVVVVIPIIVKRFQLGCWLFCGSCSCCCSSCCWYSGWAWSWLTPDVWNFRPSASRILRCSWTRLYIWRLSAGEERPEPCILF